MVCSLRPAWSSSGCSIPRATAWSRTRRSSPTHPNSPAWPRKRSPAPSRPGPRSSTPSAMKRSAPWPGSGWPWPRSCWTRTNSCSPASRPSCPIPGIDHILKVCLISGMKERLASAESSEGFAEKHALKLIRKDDEDRAAWVEHLRGSQGPLGPQPVRPGRARGHFRGGQGRRPDRRAARQPGGQGHGRLPGQGRGLRPGRQGRDRAGRRGPQYSWSRPGRAPSP